MLCSCTYLKSFSSLLIFLRKKNAFISRKRVCFTLDYPHPFFYLFFPSGSGWWTDHSLLKFQKNKHCINDQYCFFIILSGTSITVRMKHRYLKRYPRSHRRCKDINARPLSLRESHPSSENKTNNEKEYWRTAPSAVSCQSVGLCTSCRSKHCTWSHQTL